MQVNINPNQATIKVGQTVRLTAQATGGVAPYGYQWGFGVPPEPPVLEADLEISLESGGVYLTTVSSGQSSGPYPVAEGFEAAAKSISAGQVIGVKPGTYVAQRPIVWDWRNGITDGGSLYFETGALLTRPSRGTYNGTDPFDPFPSGVLCPMNLDGWRFENLTINANAAGNPRDRSTSTCCPAYITACIKAFNMNHFTLNNSTLLDATHDGWSHVVWYSMGNRWRNVPLVHRITNNYIDIPGWNCITYWDWDNPKVGAGSNNDILIEGNEWMHCSDVGAAIYGIGGVTFRNNYIHDLTGWENTVAQWGIGFEPYNDSYSPGMNYGFTNQLVENNVFERCKTGVCPQDGQVTIRNNIMRQCQWGVWDAQSSGGNIIEGNQVIDWNWLGRYQGTGASPWSNVGGAVCVSSDNNIIRNNTFRLEQQSPSQVWFGVFVSNWGEGNRPPLGTQILNNCFDARLRDDIGWNEGGHRITDSGTGTIISGNTTCT